MKKYKTRNIIAVVLILVSFIFLIPGLIEPMITLSGSVKILVFKKQVFQDTRSILQTVANLAESKNYFVAFLILFFSILVPFFKGILLITALSIKNKRKRYTIYNVVRNISKWSMADVFVVGIFVAFLAARAIKNMDASIEPGFYFFTTYCLLSLLALQFLKIESPAR
ncbi:MAG: paraquat-inducible protein A [Candidatus Aminicenantes bacterium]|nr:paraquat-inducible protein A [Candidatus Aminicenantes bacterium]